MSSFFAVREASAAGPSLKITKAVYRADQNVLEFAFQVDNPTDSVLFVDCQGSPAVSLDGKALTLVFAALDSASADTARPQRVGARQGFQGHRRIFGLGPDDAGGAVHPSDPGAKMPDPAAASRIKVVMAAYPERLEGEGVAWVQERAMRLSAPPAALARSGKRPPAKKPVRVIKPPEE